MTDDDIDIDPGIDSTDPRLDVVDALVEQWHDLPLTAPPLAEFLGLAPDEYLAYATRNELAEGYVPPGSITDDIWEPLRVFAMVAAILIVTALGLWWFQPGGKP